MFKGNQVHDPSRCSCIVHVSLFVCGPRFTTTQVEAAQGSHHSMAGAHGRDAAKAEFEAAIRKGKGARVGNTHNFVAQQQGGVNAVVVPEYRGSRMHGTVGVDSRGRRLFEPTPVPNSQEQRKAIQHHGFNATLSESLPLDREILDKRAPACRADSRNYPADLSGLPDTTVIFVFVNEEKSVLLRSIHSVLNRSPPHLLKEIILVDDGSDEDYITGGVDVPGSLEEYVMYLLVTTPLLECSSCSTSVLNGWLLLCQHET